MQSITEKLGAPPVFPSAQNPPSLRELTLAVTVSTPMAGGGVKAGEVDMNRPIRIPSVKGHLRFWWRMMNRNSPDKDTRESEIWGSTDSPGKVYISITEQPGVKLRYSNNDFEFGKDDPKKYALFSFLRNKTNPGKNIAQKNFSFTLNIQYPEKYHNDVRLAFSAWIYFGGIGSRTRRGCGSLSCSGDIMSLGEILNSAPYITVWQKRADDSTSAWSYAVRKYRDYRQMKEGGKYGRSQWPEADSIRMITGKPIKNPARSPLPSFPRAALGMPVHFRFQGQQKDIKVTPAIKDSSRMASPVITKALCDNGIWYSAVIILPHENIFDTPLEIDGIKYALQPMRGTIYKSTLPMQGKLDAISGFEEFIRGDFTKGGTR